MKNLEENLLIMEIFNLKRKDQMDQDKRELRLMKEMYLADGEFHSKNSRRKQFRWKNLDGNKYN